MKSAETVVLCWRGPFNSHIAVKKGRHALGYTQAEQTMVAVQAFKDLF